MLILLLDEPGLFVYASSADAEREIEGVDVENELRAVYDDMAVPHRVEWLRPNRYEKWFFGLVNTVASGRYRFVPAGPPDPGGLASLLEAHLGLGETKPPEARAELLALLSRLRAV